MLGRDALAIEDEDELDSRADDEEDELERVDCALSEGEVAVLGRDTLALEDDDEEEDELECSR